MVYRYKTMSLDIEVVSKPFNDPTDMLMAINEFLKMCITNHYYPTITVLPPTEA